MAVHQPADEDNEDDETPYVYTSGIPSVGLAGGRAARSRSPLVISLFNTIDLKLVVVCQLKKVVNHVASSEISEILASSYFYVSDVFILIFAR